MGGGPRPAAIMWRVPCETIQSLGILLAWGPGTAAARDARRLATAAAGRGLTVRLFLMAEGADLLASDEIFALDRPGITVSACTQSVISRKLPMDIPFIDYASQFQLARIVTTSGRFVSFA